MPRLDLSPEANRDLIDIGLYIARQSGSRQRAETFLDLIQRTAELLATQPEMGELRPEFSTGQYRGFSVGNYVIYFRPVSDGILILLRRKKSITHYGLITYGDSCRKA